jgi:hypothetical protein
MTSALPPAELLTEYILEKLSEEPVGKRILLYRAIAIETKCPVLTAACRRLANELEAIEARHEQLVLDFKRRAGG